MGVPPDMISEGDINQLRQSLTASNGKDVVQLGKYNVNIGDGKDIHIGDKVYQGADAQTIRTILLEIRICHLKEVFVLF
jgi:Effector-associated domain 10